MARAVDLDYLGPEGAQRRDLARGGVGVGVGVVALDADQRQQAGADLVKLFPAPADVAAYVTAILGPLPALRIFTRFGSAEFAIRPFLRQNPKRALAAMFGPGTSDPEDAAPGTTEPPVAAGPTPSASWWTRSPR